MGSCPMHPDNIPAAWTPEVIAVETARGDGAEYARAGLARDCNPHPDGSAEAVAWDQGWFGYHGAAAITVKDPSGAERVEPMPDFLVDWLYGEAGD